jgi:hypothetical protein
MFSCSKIIKLNSLRIQLAKMRKAVIVIIILSGIVYLSSCKKLYHCACTYNNKVVFTKDIGSQVEDNAKDICTSYDSTITGEAWNCTIY